MNTNGGRQGLFDDAGYVFDDENEIDYNVVSKKEADHFILCDDALPAENDEYLVLWRDDFSKKTFYEIVEFCNGDWQTNSITQAMGYVTIEAWMTLPEIPERLKGGE